MTQARIIRAATRLAAGILALAVVVAPLAAQPQPAVHVPRAVLERYVGEYVYPSGRTVVIRLVGDTLVREASGQQLAYVPLSETLFRAGPVFTAEFVRDQAGEMTQVLTDGVDVEYRLRRTMSGAATATATPAASPAPPVAAVRVPRPVLERYVGEYELIPGQIGRTDLVIVVRLEGDSLTRRISAGQTVVLTPLSATRFRVGSTALEAEFVVDEAGGVTQIMGSGSQRLLARRTRRP